MTMFTSAMFGDCLLGGSNIARVVDGMCVMRASATLVLFSKVVLFDGAHAWHDRCVVSAREHLSFKLASPSK